MEKTLQKWGNSLAARIPAEYAAALHLTEGARVDMVIEDGRLVLTPRHSRVSMADILATMPEGSAQEFDMGQDVGDEVLPPY